MQEKESYDTSIIDVYVQNSKPYKFHLDIIGEPIMKPTGRFVLKKHKYKLINIWRKLTKTEKYEEEYEFTYETPY